MAALSRRLARALRTRADLRTASKGRSPGSPPPLLADPLAALHLARDQVPVAFECQLQWARDTQGFSFGSGGWHPLVATISGHDDPAAVRYPGSILERYYRIFRPRSALEAIPSFRAHDPCGLADLPPHLFWLTPWLGVGPEELDRRVRQWVDSDLRTAGLVDFDFDRDGNLYHGPASEPVGCAEARRLASVTSSLLAHGYDRYQGDSRFYLVCRDGDFRAIKLGSGLHRTVAAAALGHSSIPARFHHPIAVDVRDVADWPQVRAGVWSVRDALGYVDHLFDFDAAQWAVAHQLA
jgi:hypothetical protein